MAEERRAGERRGLASRVSVERRLGGDRRGGADRRDWAGRHNREALAALLGIEASALAGLTRRQVVEMTVELSRRQALR